MANEAKILWTDMSRMSFINFLRSHGPNVTLRKTEVDGNLVASLRLVTPEGATTYVGFSRSLGELTASQLLERAASLDVVSGFNKEGKLKHVLSLPDGENIDFIGLL